MERITKHIGFFKSNDYQNNIQKLESAIDSFFDDILLEGGDIIQTKTNIDSNDNIVLTVIYSSKIEDNPS